MWTFIGSNAPAINVVLNALMLMVWAFYFQMLLSSNRRQRRPKILINRSAGHDLSANCIVTNMSAEPIYLEAVVLRLFPGGETNVCSLTDLDTLVKQPTVDPRRNWFQGPLSSGEYLTLGSFSDLLMDANGANPARDVAQDDPACDIGWVEGFEMLVIATYGPDHGTVGTQRRFDRTDAGPTARWRASQTHQMRWPWERARLRAYLRESG